MRACLSSYLLPFLAPIIPRLCITVFTFAQPFLVDTTVTFVSQESPDTNYGRGLIGAWALAYLGLAVSNSIFMYHSLRFATRVRGGLVGLIYHQAIHHREVDAGEITAVALMGTDVERIFGSMTVFHIVWGSLLDIAVASWLLGLQLSLACLAPILLSLVFIAAIPKISAASNKAQKLWIEKIQQRLRATTTMLGEMKAVKMLGLTRVMESLIQGLRADEINTSKGFRKLLVATLLLSLTPTSLAPIVTFAVYVVISIFWKSETLLPAQAFTSIALISLLTTPLLLFIQLLPVIVQSFACFGRIQEFCNYGGDARANLDERDDSQDQSEQDATDIELAGPGMQKRMSQKLDNVVASFRGESLGWKRDQPVLHNIDVGIRRGAVTVIVGSVGSGKSTFLSAVLGDLVNTDPKNAGKTKHTQHLPMAFCSQTPWLENGTIRQNILGVSPYEEKWYNIVTSSCGLDPDLQALQGGDLTVVGSQGVNLSGGQKQRIALARAVYSRRMVFVLDDVFSGMDAHTSHHVAVSLIGSGGLLRRHRATVIIATHSHKIMSSADTLISMEDGQIKEIGSPLELSQGEGYVRRLGLNLSTDDPVPNPPEEHDRSNLVTQQHITSISEQPNEVRHTDKRRKNGEKAVYKYYLENAGWNVVFLYVGGVVMWLFLAEFSTIWMKWWSESNAANPNQRVGYYLGIYAMFGVLGAVGASVAGWVAFLDVVSNTALNLHSDLLRTTLQATFRFLSKVDSGELLNRFSEDMQLLDMDLPTAMVNASATAVTVVVKVAILAVFSQYLGITLPFLAVMLYFLQRFYLQTSRQVRLLGIEAKAPLYTHFSESVAGSATIRAFQWQSQYQNRNYDHIDTSQRPAYVQFCIQTWLGFVLNVMVAALAVILVSIVVTWHNKFSPGSVGVSLVMVIGFSEELARFIQTWTKMESSVGAVARIRRFVQETETEPTSGKRKVDKNWPRAGAVQFHRVVASYGVDTEAVLKGVSLSIEAGHHVAICGRSGSGKTSLILSLLQMVDVDEGNITVDGVDVSTLLQDELRSAVNVVSQDPFLVPGSIRFNINPSATGADDERITQALQRVGLWQAVQEQGGLDEALDDKAWSAGQKQLLCLARAMVKQSKLLILDEAMSSVDSHTESLMQNIVDTEFHGCTVLAVMHHLKHVDRYDRVALLGDGKLLEFGDPGSLIAGDTKFAELYKANGS
ncbi:ABC transporter ecdL [Colletotrichum sidae]|uniref:ABC transporter ecdL n=1 Tax=Colletotrichum sidae TaxID=1347389 RepID=A0A4R8T3I3_9PEZI|nr:ABC transporter ecdL [Colletotrichum sidae]